MAVTAWSINFRHRGPVCPAALEPLEHSRPAPADDPTAAGLGRRCAKPSDRCFDVVITWRNASGAPNADTEMLYVLRSLERFGMDRYIRLVHVVAQGRTDASLPWYLDLASPTLRLHRHTAIFRNQSHLPTASRNAIKANLVNIPDLAPLFVQLDDDILLTAPFRIDTFIREVYADTPKLELTYNDERIAHLLAAGSAIPLEATERVPQLVQYMGYDIKWAQDDALDKCTDNAPSDGWESAWACSAHLLRRQFGPVVVTGSNHCPHIASVKLMREAWKRWDSDWQRTSAGSPSPGTDESSDTGDGIDWHVFMGGYTLATTTALGVPMACLPAFCQELHTNAAYFLGSDFPPHRCKPGKDGAPYPEVVAAVENVKTALRNSVR